MVAFASLAMSERKYYSLRTGRNPNAKGIDLATLRSLFYNLYTRLDRECYFQEYFGYYCVDADFVAGKVGTDVGAVIRFKLRKDHLWTIGSNLEEYSEDDVFDMVEFLYDHVSKPLDGRFHSYSNCGWHYETFDRAAGQKEYRDAINPVLADYSTGYELSEDGEIIELVERGMEPLLEAGIPVKDTNVTGRVASAVRKFRRYKSTPDDRRDAVRDLADVLEYLRPQLKAILDTSDEKDLFNIANNFSIRHHNEKQKTNYDARIWLNWVFYFYLATIHAALRMLAREQPSSGKAT